MSQATFAAEPDIFPWDTTARPEPAYQEQDVLDSCGGKICMTVINPVQRVDSFGASDHSHDTFAAFSPGAPFNFDHSTPDRSTDEDTFNTPDFDDILWQQDHLVVGLNNDHARTNSSVLAHNTRTGSSGLASHKTSLPSPQSTNISTPEASASHSKQLSQNSTFFISPTSTPSQLKQTLQMSASEMDEPHTSDYHLPTPVQPPSHVTSPTIQISRHSRGDSPARSDYDRGRTNKKRHASSLSQGEYFPDVTAHQHLSHLMPPGHGVEQNWNEAEERTGLSPSQRGNEETHNFDDLDQQNEHERTISVIQHWFERTSLALGAERHARTQRLHPDRLRSRSTGGRYAPEQQPILMTPSYPGPGREIDETSDYYYSTDSESQHSLALDEYPATNPADLPVREESERTPDDLEPLPSQFIFRRPWQDPYPVQRPDDNTRFQPDTSEAAIRKFALRAKEFDTASRRATWGTGRFRRMSEGDVDSVTGDTKTHHLSLAKIRMRERGISIVAKAKEQVLKRSNSRSKQLNMQGHLELEKVQSPEPIEERSSTESQRAAHSSHIKPKSPSIGAALIGASNNLAAVGAGSTDLSIETEQAHEGFFRKAIRRVRSKSDVNKSPKSPSLVTLKVAQPGGPPFPSQKSPGFDQPNGISHGATPVDGIHETATSVRTPVKMPLSPRPANVMPDLKGFRVQIRELNPNLAPYLVERIAHDQVRRYKRLVTNKVDHAAAVADGKCASLHMCPAVGGQAEILPARSGGRDAASSSAHFKVASGADSDNEDSAFDGVVTPAAFPDGIPLPPAKKLPARFECPLCFQVKSFQKPSDWTKHVHEDVQPFTCTFPNCPEPKSFKRKADWVRHENERHRHLEWWKCNLSECKHVCYRKDNFVQHLVREHKRKEPKIKRRANSNGKGKAQNMIFNTEEQAFWDLVDACRHEGTSDARQEPCKFCGNICASWKKLSVHIGKHMEQIAMPVLELAEKRNVTRDTVISPIEPIERNTQFYKTEQSIMPDISSNPMSPYTQSGASNYQASSAGHSPLVGQAQRRFISNNSHLVPAYDADSLRQGNLSSVPFTMAMTAGTSGFPPPQSYGGTQFGSYHGQHVVYSQNHHLTSADMIPRTSAMRMDYMNTVVHGNYDEQSQYFSSPEQQYASYPSQVVGMNSVMGQSAIMQNQHLQTPVTGDDLNAHTYPFAQQQNPWDQH